MLGVHEQQLRSWERQQLIPVNEVYSFSELAALRTLVQLRAQGLKPERIRRTLNAARDRLNVANPLTELRLFLDGSRIGVKAEGLMIDPETGQMLLEFDGLSVVAQSFPSSHIEAAEAEQRRKRRAEAEFWFQQGLQAEQAGANQRVIQEAYNKCLEIDPAFASALVNLGTLHFNQRRHAEAEEFYRRAVEADTTVMPCSWHQRR